MEQPFQVGDTVRVRARYPSDFENMGRMLRTITRVGAVGVGECASGWLVDASAERCPHCGVLPPPLREYDSGWFEKDGPAHERGED